MDRRAYAETAGLTSNSAWLRSEIAFPHRLNRDRMLFCR